MQFRHRTFGYIFEAEYVCDTDHILIEYQFSRLNKKDHLWNEI